jgi:hypothetical protein
MKSKWAWACLPWARQDTRQTAALKKSPLLNLNAQPLSSRQWRNSGEANRPLSSENGMPLGLSGDTEKTVVFGFLLSRNSLFG